MQDLSARGVGLRVLAGQGAQIDTTTAAGRLVFGIFAALAEFERERGRAPGAKGWRCSRAWTGRGEEAEGATVEAASGRGHDQAAAAPASPKTTKLYDRTGNTLTVDEIEQIVI